MLRTFLALLILGTTFATVVAAQEPAPPVEGRVLKVLPHLLDPQGKHTISPSLFDRDAYQAHLSQHPDEVSGIRYDVNWKARQAADQQLTVRVELRGLFEGKVPREKTLESVVDGRSSIRRWTGLELTGDEYTQFGKITAWRATLWSDGKMLDEYKSFLW